MNAEQAVKTLSVYLDRKGLKFTNQRRTITETFFDPKFSEEHPTIEELHDRVRIHDPRIGYATVYRTMKLLVDCELASTRRLGDNHTRYEPEVAGEHHDHLVCSDCGLIIEFENEQIERLQEDVARTLGFEIDKHRLVLYGRCVRGCERPGFGPSEQSRNGRVNFLE